MSFNYQSVPFWDFVRAFDDSGAGVDHPAGGHPYSSGPSPAGPFPPGAGFPFDASGFFGPRGFGAGSWGGRGGHGGRPYRRNEDAAHQRTPHGSREASPSGENENPESDNNNGERRAGSPHGPRGPHHHHHGPGGRHGRGRHGRGGFGGFRGPHPPFGGPAGPAGAPFDLSALIASLSSHPIAQALRTYAEQAAAGAAGPTTGADAQRSGETLVPEDTDSESSFTPPIDIFSTPIAYILHIALPGAKKEDVGVNWDAEKSILNIAGVVYRQGDEAFLKTLSRSERKVGVFERTVKLPPGEEEEKEEVDGDAITARLEDGVLVVTVPKVEREWTDVKKVDIL